MTGLTGQPVQPHVVDVARRLGLKLVWTLLCVGESIFLLGGREQVLGLLPCVMGL